MNKLDFESLYKFLENAEDEHFFGEISFRYRDGIIYQIYKGQSMKLEDLKNQYKITNRS